MYLLLRNLQEAIGSYYDYKIESLPQMSLEGDITTGDGEAIPPNTQFTKTWRVKNSGTFLQQCTTIYMIL